MKTLRITVEIHEIAQNWWADVPRKRLLEMMKSDGFVEADLEIPERLSELRWMSEQRSLDPVKWCLKRESDSLHTFVFERLGISIQGCREICMVERIY